MNIKKYMKENGIKQVDIVKSGGLSEGYVSKIINGKMPVTYSFIQAFSDATGKSTNYWLFGEDKYNGLASLNKLVDTFIEDGDIKEDGSFDKEIETILLTMLRKEIKDKLKERK